MGREYIRKVTYTTWRKKVLTGKGEKEYTHTYILLRIPMEVAKNWEAQHGRIEYVRIKVLEDGSIQVAPR